MFNAGEILEAIPSAKMDEDMIQIPISEYEKFRDHLMYQDKQSLIRELQQLLQDKDEDLQRYKDKLETTDSVLQRTQTKLDKLMIQFSKGDKPVKLLVPRSMNIQPAPKSVSSRSPGPLVPRTATNSDSRKAIEHDESNMSSTISSMPASQSTVEPESTADHIKSLPIGLGMSGFAPGMSSALLQKLVTENLTLRKQLEALNNGKPWKLNKDSQVQDLKFQLKKKQDQLDELKKQLSIIPLGKESDPSSPNTFLLEKVDRLETTLELNKVIIASLKEQKESIEREKVGLDTLLEKYRTETEQKYRQAENRYNEDRIVELESELETRKKAYDNAVTKLETVQQELDSIKHRFETMEQERDMAVQNYQTVVAEVRNMRAPPAPYPPAPYPAGPIPRQAFVSSPSSYSQYPQGSLTPRSDQYSSAAPEYVRSDAPVLPPRIPTQHRNTTSSSTHAPPPPPRDKRMLKCPRCEAVFDLLQAYREHIKVCLKSTH